MRYLTPAPDAPPPTQTAVIAPIAAADRVVDRHRRTLDTAAGWGIPAHVTVLYPFLDPGAVDETAVTRLVAAVGSVGAFSCTFRRLAWFGERVLYLEPDPAEPFGALTAAVWAAFPGTPPYGGGYEQVVPHLTVAQRGAADLSQLRAAEQEVRNKLPVHASVDHALLVAGSDAPRSWRTLHRLPLGAGRRAGRSTR